MPIISVIVPVYKVEPYLRRCVDSILAQTFQDFELILVDDGSPDNCPAICDEYAQSNSCIHVIHKKNGGPSSARNAGMQIASGKYIMFCDSDDCVTPDWCETMLNYIQKNPYNWVVSNIWKVSCDGLCKPIVIYDIGSNQNHLSYFDIYKIGLSPYAVNKIYNSELLKKNNLFFDETCFFGEDIEFNVKYFSACSGITYISQPTYYYFENPTGIMGKYRWDLFSQNLKHFRDRLPVIQENELSQFCDIFFYYFLTWLENTFDSRNKMSFLKKMQYNQRMMQTEEFRFCVDHVTGKNDSPLFMRIVRTHNFYLYWLFQKAAQFKAKLFPAPKLEEI